MVACSGRGEVKTRLPASPQLLHKSDLTATCPTIWQSQGFDHLSMRFLRQEELEQQQEDKLNLEEKYASTEEQVAWH